MTVRSSSPTNAVRDLHQHLIWQLEISPLDPRQLWIGEAIVDALNDDGYLTDTAEEIAQSLTANCPCQLRTSRKCSRSCRRSIPAGIGARNMSECITLQLAQLEPETPGRDSCHQHRTRPPAGRSQPQCRGTAAIARLGRRIVQVALTLIRGCHPRPAAAFEGAIPNISCPTCSCAGRTRAGRSN
jgi:RNA polymerase sigma-54 factor